MISRLFCALSQVAEEEKNTRMVIRKGREGDVLRWAHSPFLTANPLSLKNLIHLISGLIVIHPRSNPKSDLTSGLLSRLLRLVVKEF